MTIDEKRQVIEVLLCAASQPGVSVFHAKSWLGHMERVAVRAMDRRHAALMNLNADKGRWYTTSANEAAYRLIESSPTLRREWFGR